MQLAEPQGTLLKSTENARAPAGAWPPHCHRPEAGTPVTPDSLRLCPRRRLEDVLPLGTFSEVAGDRACGWCPSPSGVQGGSGRAPLAAPLPGRWLEKPFPPPRRGTGGGRVRLEPTGEVVRKAAGGGGGGQGGSVDGLWAQSEMYLRGLSPAPEVFSTARGTDVRGW